MKTSALTLSLGAIAALLFLAGKIRAEDNPFIKNKEENPPIADQPETVAGVPAGPQNENRAPRAPRPESRSPFRDHNPRMDAEEFVKNALAMDANFDGLISREEFRGPDQVFERVDADGNATLDHGEIESASERIRKGGDGMEGRPEPGGPPAPEMILARLDADKDGRISETEAQGPIAEHFARIDANSDGFADAGELTEFTLKVRERMRDARPRPPVEGHGPGHDGERPGFNGREPESKARPPHRPEGKHEPPTSGFRAGEFDPNHAEHLFIDLDVNRDGLISREEFVTPEAFKRIGNKSGKPRKQKNRQ